MYEQVHGLHQAIRLSLVREATAAARKTSACAFWRGAHVQPSTRRVERAPIRVHVAVNQGFMRSVLVVKEYAGGSQDLVPGRQMQGQQEEISQVLL